MPTHDHMNRTLSVKDHKGKKKTGADPFPDTFCSLFQQFQHEEEHPSPKQ
jgi:hypothetical protein